MTNSMVLKQSILGLGYIAALTLGASVPAAAQAEVAHTTKNIVLVHGGFVDGSGWQGVYDALTKKGYAVTIVQNPTASLTDDVAFTKRAISAQDGYLFLDKSKFAASFAADVQPRVAAFMAVSQVPWGVQALGGKVTQPAWRSKPSWYLVSTKDKMIPPDAQRSMSKRSGSTVVEVKGSHAVYVSRPDAVAALIERAAKGQK